MSTPCSTAGGSAIGSSGCGGVALAPTLKEAAARIAIVALITLISSKGAQQRSAV
jgi:hypothetical protein